MKEVILSTKSTLDSIKPTPARLEGWNRALPPLFDWEVKSLNGLANVDISKFEKDFTKDDIPLLDDLQAEIKRMRQMSKSLEDERKSQTKVIDEFKQRLMFSEKGYSLIAEHLEEKFIILKRIESDEKRKIEARNNEILRFKIAYSGHLESSRSEWLQYNIDAVNLAFEKAIKEIDPKDLTEYVNKILWNHTEREFVMPAFPWTKVQLEDRDFVLLSREIDKNWDSKSLYEDFTSKMRTTFADFEAKKFDSLASIEEAKNEAVILKEEVVQEAMTNVAVNEIVYKAEIQSAPAIITSKTKDLKKTYVINMEHTKANMLIIDKAFYANADACLSYYSGKDCWKIDAVKKAELLCKLKNADNNFAPDNVVFSEEEKVGRL